MDEITGTVAIDHLRAQVEELDAVRDRIASLQKREKELIAQLRAGIGTHQFGSVDGEEAVRIDARVNSHLDREATKALVGAEAFGTLLRQTPYTAVKVIGSFRRAR